MGFSPRERKVTIIGILALVTAAVTYGFLSSSGTFKDDKWNLGGAIVGYLAAVLVLNKVYGQLDSNDSQVEGATSYSFPVLKRDHKKAVLIQGAETVTYNMVEAAKDAQTYIYTIGGKARNEKFLNTISERVVRGNIRYIRVITGDHIRHQLCRHLHELQEIVELGYYLDRIYGNIMVTHDTTIIALPCPNSSALENVLKVKSREVASDYREYITELLGSSEKITNFSLIENLCKTCRGSRNRNT